MRKFIGLTLIFLLFACVVFSFAASAEMEITGYTKLSKGDYMEFETEVDLGDMEGDIEYEIDKSEHKYEVIGEEKVTAGDGKEYDCYKVKIRMMVKGSGSMSTEGITANTEMDMDSVITSWITKDGWVEVKSEEEYTSYTKMEYEGIEGTMFEQWLKDTESETEQTGANTYEKVHQAPPFPIKVGDSWEEEEKYKYEGEDKTRTKEGDGDWGDWETTDESYTTTNTEEIEVLKEEEVKVKAGTFKCLVLKIIEDPDYSDDYELMYIDSRGLWVKTETYYEGELENTVELKSYSLSGGSSANPLPGFGILAFLGVIGFGYLIPRKR